MPPPASSSARFARIYESLPREAQSALVEKQLIALLDIVPKDRAKKVISAATHLQTRHSSAPVLDLKAKKKEINDLLDGLGKECKRSFLKERSSKDEYLAEAVESLVDWLSDIWSNVYEYNANFTLAHSCLILTADVLDHILNIRGGCKCSITNMFVPITFKQSSGTIVKSFSLTGAHNIDSVLLWIWRDLFVSLLAHGTPAERKLVPDMLVDIEGIMGWQALERLLYGGKKSLSDDGDDEDEDDDSYFLGECYEEEGDGDDKSDFCCRCHYHAGHWSGHINNQRVQLRECVLERLTTIFGISPSVSLYNSILSLCVNAEETADELRELLSSAATNCPENFAAALDIHASDNNTDDILTLLESHSHLLRSRDANTLQSAVATLSNNPFFHLRGLQIVEKELLSTARTIHTALLSCFSNIDQEANKEEINRITILRMGSPTRHDRVRRWVDAVMTPGSLFPGPINFAALLMGLPDPPPPLPPMEEDTDPFIYLDMDESDPDLEDLREEFRPNLKERFDGWNVIALSIPGGSSLLLDVYVKLMGIMPFLRATDAVDEMINRLADKPNKHHICDALDALSAFSKSQKKKILLRDKPQTEPQSPSHPNGAMGFAFSFGSGGPHASSSSGMYHPSRSGGMEDVD